MDQSDLTKACSITLDSSLLKHIYTSLAALFSPLKDLVICHCVCYHKLASITFTNNSITHLCPRFRMNHIQNAALVGDANLFCLVVGYSFIIWKVKRCPEHTHPVMSSAVSMAPSLNSRGSFTLMQGWIISGGSFFLLSDQTIDYVVHHLWNLTI